MQNLLIAGNIPFSPLAKCGICDEHGEFQPQGLTAVGFTCTEAALQLQGGGLESRMEVAHGYWHRACVGGVFVI